MQELPEYRKELKLWEVAMGERQKTTTFVLKLSKKVTGHFENLMKAGTYITHIHYSGIAMNIFVQLFL